MQEWPVLVRGNVRRREEEERVLAKQPTSIVLTLVNVSSPSAKIMYDTEAYKWKFDYSFFIYPSNFWVEIIFDSSNRTKKPEKCRSWWSRNRLEADGSRAVLVIIHRSVNLMLTNGIVVLSLDLMFVYTFTIQRTHTSNWPSMVQVPGLFTNGNRARQCML